MLMKEWEVVLSHVNRNADKVDDGLVTLIREHSLGEILFLMSPPEEREAVDREGELFSHLHVDPVTVFFGKEETLTHEDQIQTQCVLLVTRAVVVALFGSFFSWELHKEMEMVASKKSFLLYLAEQRTCNRTG
ncbi:hypothetical protein V6N13_020966 [Hibiscus sabdariffa]